jgi:hypothetical protein
MRRAIAIVSLVAVLVPGTSSATQAAFRRHAVPGYGVSLELPSTWRAISWRQVLGSSDLQRLSRDNPDVAGSIAALAQPHSPVEFFAFDPQVANHFATNVNLIVTPLARTVDFSTYRRSVVDEIGSVASVSNLSDATVRLPAGRAVRLSYRIRLRTGGRDLTASVLQYAFLRVSKSFVFTYTTLPASARFYAAAFGPSARSIRFS